MARSGVRAQRVSYRIERQRQPRYVPFGRDGFKRERRYFALLRREPAEQRAFTVRFG